MTEHDALLAAILAQPDEDTPRLVYADFLDENGDPDRAEFIRVQIELARQRASEPDWPEDIGTTVHVGGPDGYSHQAHDPPELIALLRRESELLALHREEWLAGLPEYAIRSQVRFRRGFVWRVAAETEALVRNPAALWDRYPVESLNLARAERESRDRILECKSLARVRELVIGGSIRQLYETTLLAPLIHCPHLAGLATLDLSQRTVDRGTAEILSESDVVQPTALKFGPSELPPSALGCLLESRFSSRLRRLEVQGVSTWSAAVIGSTTPADLRVLRIPNSGCGDSEVAALARSAYLTHLVTLDLTDNALTDVAMESLAGWPGLATVRVLMLGFNPEITGRGVEALTRSPHFNPVHLALPNTFAGTVGAKALARWPGLANVVGLDLARADVGVAGAAALADSPHWRDLRHLKLTGNVIGDPTLDRLRERLGAAVDVVNR